MKTHAPYVSEDRIDALQRLIQQAHATVMLLESHFNPGLGGSDDDIALNALWSVQCQLEGMMESSRQL